MKAPTPFYITNNGQAFNGDARALLETLDDRSIDLVITSPPFALQRQKEYGNEPQERYVEWLLSFTDGIKRVLKESGSFVIDLGGAYCKGRPVRSLYNFRFLIKMCDEKGWNLAEEFFWYNPSKLPSPIEWVNKRKIRAKDAVNTIWWFSKSDFPKANVSQVLVPYSERMKLLLKNGDRYYTPKKRPSGHDISSRFRADNGGAIPPNLIQTPNSESNSQYLRFCKVVGVKAHPARFPARLPEFFIDFLTEPGDVVLDIFAGSNTTGAVAEQRGRRWLAFESEREYLAASAFRFLEEKADDEEVQAVFDKLISGSIERIEIPQPPGQDLLFEKTSRGRGINLL